MNVNLMKKTRTLTPVTTLNSKKLKRNMKVIAFLDHLHEKQMLGEGILIEKKSMERNYHNNYPLTYIVKDQRSYEHQEVYRVERWEVLFRTLTPLGRRYHLKEDTCAVRPFRVLHADNLVGTHYHVKDEIDENFGDMRRDNFEIVRGWGDCF